MRVALAAPFLLLLACGFACQSASVDRAAGELRVEPRELDFGEPFVGTVATRSLELINAGRSRLALRLKVDPPFVPSVETLELEGGEAVTVELRFEPAEVGAVSQTATLEVEGSAPVRVGLHASAREQPRCEPAPICHRTWFDPRVEACQTSVSDDGVPCSNGCVSEGACVGGECRGAVGAQCEDHDLCTVDGCASDGSCLHVPRVCEVTAPCLTAYCDPALGCRTAPVDDGTACGASTCRTARICLEGACVSRPQPNAEDECSAVELVSTYWGGFCLLSRAGSFRCWGDSLSGGWFPPVTFRFSRPAVAAGVGSYEQWAILDDGTIENGFGARVTPGPGVRALEVFGDDPCWRLSTGEVRCRSLPSPVGRFVSAAAGEEGGLERVCAVRDDGGVACQVGPGWIEIELAAPARALSISGNGGALVVHEAGVSRIDATLGRSRWLVSGSVDQVAGLWFPLGPHGVLRDGGLVSASTVSDGGLEFFPVDAGLVRPVSRVSVSKQTVCAMTNDGQVACRGDNAFGRLGDLSPAPPMPSPAGLEDSRVMEVDVFGTTVATVLGDGGVVMWGNGEPRPQLQPFDGRGTKALRVVRTNVCALSTAGVVSCWDGAHTRVLELPPVARFLSTEVRDTPSGVVPVTRVLTDGGQQCQWSPDGGAPVCFWNGDLVEELRFRQRTLSLWGDGGVTGWPGAEPMRRLASSRDQLCGLGASGRVWCADDVVPPHAMAGLLPAGRALTCNVFACCVLVGENGVSCWGRNNWNALGRSGGASDTPVAVPLPGRVESLSSGGNTTCALLSSGRVWCWGSNREGQRGVQPMLSSPEWRWLTE